MKLVCIKEENNRHTMKLKLNSIYDGEIVHNRYIYLDNDYYYWGIFLIRNLVEKTWVFSKTTFMPLSEWREQQLNEILNGEE